MANTTIADARELTRTAYQAAVDRMPPVVGRIVGYHAGWCDVEGNLSICGGKAIRPCFVFASAAAVNPDIIDDAVVAAAAAVEMVHDFSLLHDDVMDGDEQRRGRPAAWTVFGTGMAVLAGDALLMHSLDILATPAGVRVLTVAALELCRGQAQDLAFETADVVTVSEYLAMAEDKTGALLGAACQLGAMAAGADEHTADAYRRFGRELGVAFQICDDLLGIWGDPAVTGKPHLADLARRKKTLPVVEALTSHSHPGTELARVYRIAEPLTHAQLIRAAELIEAAGGRAHAQREADQRVRRAWQTLTTTHLAARSSVVLQTLVDMLTDRSR